MVSGVNNSDTPSFLSHNFLPPFVLYHVNLTLSSVTDNFTGGARRGRGMQGRGSEQEGGGARRAGGLSRRGEGHAGQGVRAGGGRGTQGRGSEQEGRGKQRS